MKTDNELIAEFMEQPLTFTYSWNDIMPVVEAIEAIEEPHPSNNPMKGTVWPYQVEILSRQRVEIYDHIEERSIVTINEDGLTKIESVYKAVVEFIKWYQGERIGGKNSVEQTGTK